MESHYILEEPVNGLSLRELIANFTNDNLSRSFKSITSFKNKSISAIGKKKIKNSSIIYLPELDSSSFLPTVMKNNKVINIYLKLYQGTNIFNRFHKRRL